MAKHDKDIEYVGDSKVPAQRESIDAPSYDEYPGKTELFWPNFLLKEWMVAAVVLFAFLVMTVMHPAPLEAKADPTNAAYIPLPDWYFLFLYQLLKYPWAAGNWVIFGVIVIPGIAFGSLFLAPWLDRGPERRPSKRPVAVGLMLLSLVSIIYLSWAAEDAHKKQLAASGAAPKPAANKPPADFKPAAIWADKTKTSCQACHGAKMEGAAGPALWDEGTRMNKDQVLNIINNGGVTMPKGGMFTGTEAEKQQLAEYLGSLKGNK